MKRIAIFPGSFDPITRGHVSVVKRAIPLFDQIIIAIGENSEKKNYFTVEQRMSWIEKVFADYPTISAKKYNGLTINFCKKVNAQYILRGLRNSADFEFEKNIAQMNKKMYPEIETIFLLTAPEYTDLNSSIVRDIYRNGGDIQQFIPEEIVL